MSWMSIPSVFSTEAHLRLQVGDGEMPTSFIIRPSQLTTADMVSIPCSLGALLCGTRNPTQFRLWGLGFKIPLVTAFQGPPNEVASLFTTTLQGLYIHSGS